MLTLLATFNNPGLQIDIDHDGNWIDVPGQFFDAFDSGFGNQVIFGTGLPTGGHRDRTN